MDERPPLIVIYNGVEYMRVDPPPSDDAEARGIDVVPSTAHQRAVEERDALREAVRGFLTGVALDERGRFKDARLEALYRASGGR